MTDSEPPTVAAWATLFGHLAAQKSAVVEVAARDTGIRPERLEAAFDEVIDLVAEPVPSPEKIERWREQGIALAREGAPSERVLDAYLSLNWAMWESIMGAEEVERSVILDFGDRLLRGLDDAIAAISEGYVRVEVEMAAAHADGRRAVLEDVLSAPRTTPQDRARIRLRCERHGLAVGGTYRLILIHLPQRDPDEVASLVDELEKRIRVPSAHHHARPGIRLPVVLEWRGRVLVFTHAEWAGEQRLRQALPKVLGDDIVVIDSGPIDGVEALVDARANAEYSAAVAEALGRRGWITDTGDLALETTFLLDERLVRIVIERELGALLADARMGEELIETLEVYLGAKQNIREAARRLHLAPRTVAYRLERIEALLGHELEGETVVRVSAALLALRVSRQAGVISRPDATVEP